MKVPYIFIWELLHISYGLFIMIVCILLIYMDIG